MFLKTICTDLVSKLSATTFQNAVSAPMNFHKSAVVAGKINRMKDRTAMLRTVVKKEDGTVGEKTIDIDSFGQQ